VRSAPPSPNDEARCRALALALVRGVGAISYRERVAEFGSAAHAFDATVDPLARQEPLALARRALTDAAAAGASLVLAEDPNYPASLNDLPDPPPYLFYLGDLSLAHRLCVAIVGTRTSTAYGERTTNLLAAELAAAGAVIVSGMARGIDSAAHRAALDARGPTIAVLGTGVDVPYPVSNRSLHSRIANQGLILSELPCGTRARTGSFPSRNRIIAALARATIVVEAGVKSGARITAECAFDLSRNVAAVPGPIDSAQSVGSNLLLRDGAIVVAEVADALALVGLQRAGAGDVPPLDDDELLVWRALQSRAIDLERLVARLPLPASRVLAAVTTLELMRLVDTTPTGELVARVTR
jgi:DNA processing protein